MKKKGEFAKKRKQYVARQHVWDSCKRAKAGEDDVWCTVPMGNTGNTLCRVKLMSGSWNNYTDYAQDNGCCYVIINRHTIPVLALLSGKDGKVYTGETRKDCNCGDSLNRKCMGHGIVSNVFWTKICLARVAELHEVK